jgi:putative ABC transport system substrate-binding protein
MAIHIRRRECILTLGGAAAWPLTARAQQPAMPVIGWLGPDSRASEDFRVVPFRQALKEAGYSEGQNIGIEYRWAEGHHERLPAMAADLVRRQVTVLAPTSLPAALAAKSATTTIPIVFTIAGDPVQVGLVASFNRPGGNITGVSQYLSALAAKRLELLRELVPTAAIIGVLVNPNLQDAVWQSKEVKEAARIVGQQVHVVNTNSEGDLNTAFATLVQLKAGAIFVTADPLFTGHRDQLIALAARHKIPAIYGVREFVSAGGLMSYGSNLADGYRQAGVYVGRILKGAKPNDLPVVQPTKFELTINLKTARALGLDVPPTLLARADEVIE